jgi:hypothetical protein
MEKKRSQPKKKRGYVSIDWNSRREEMVKKCTDWTAFRSSSCPSFCAQSNSGPRSNEEQQQQHMKMGKRKGRKKQRTKGQRQPSGEQGAQGRRGMERGEEHGTVDSLWQWRQWKTSPQQGARIRHRLR